MSRLAADSADWTALGTRVRLMVTDPRRLDEGRSMLEADLAALDAACSRFRPDSELVALSAADGRPTRVSSILFEATKVALRAARLTDGDVDPTVGRAMDLIGYDRTFSAVKAGETARGPLVRVLAHSVPDWRQVSLDSTTSTITMPPGVRLDLGATAKAWAADRAASRLADALGCGAMVSLGGDIAVAGPAPQNGWTIRVQDVTGHPDEIPTGCWALVTIHDGGLATSSTAARRWRRGGEELHHIIDPRQGLPARPVWRTVTVAAASCVDANIASTASVIRGERAPAWLEHLGLPARLVDTSGHVLTVAGWPRESRETMS